MNILLLGLSYKNTPIEIREKIFFREEELKEALDRLMKDDLIKEGVILSTCNRTEIYVVAKDIDGGLNYLKRFFLESSNLELEIERYFYHKIDIEAINHLLRVVSGLDSMVLGEPQILGQVKKAYSIALENKATSFVFNYLFQKIVNIGKKIRTDTSIGKGSLSISYAAVQLAKKIFDDLSQKKVLLIGVGKMGEILIKHLKELKIKELWIMNRNFQKAEEVAKRYNGLPFDISLLYEYLPFADIVIVSTNSPSYVIKKDEFKYALTEGKNFPIFFIDISVPRNIDPSINSLQGIILYDIDDLKEVIKANRRKREEEVKSAEEIIQRELKEIAHWYSSLEVIPIIQEIKKSITLVCQRELEKNKELIKEGKIKECGENISNKILALPMSKIKKEMGSKESYLYIKALSELFQIRRES
jgi:glutamyl-tRNA reductase